jgi:hypothetical protein
MPVSVDVSEPGWLGRGRGVDLGGLRLTIIRIGWDGLIPRVEVRERGRPAF